MTARPQSFIQSIRFRLTAWYALLLLVLIGVLGLGLAFLLERGLRQDVDERLLATAREMNRQFEVSFTFTGPVVRVPPPDSFTFPSQLIEVVSSNDRVWFASENLGDRRLPEPDRALRQIREPDFGTSVVDGISVRVLYYPIILDGQTIGLVKVGEPLIQLNETLEQLRRVLVVLAASGFALAAVGGWFLAGRALAPVDRMTATARGIAAGSSSDLSLSTRLDVPATGDELARLASTFNAMLDRLEEAFETQRRFIADASHELRTPLTAIQGNVDLLARQLQAAVAGNGDLRETLDALHRESERLRRLTEDLLTLARAEAPAGLILQRSSIPVEPVIQDAVRAVILSEETPAIQLDIEPGMTVWADRDRLTQVIIILLDNAVRHTSASGQVRISAWTGRHDSRISVEDTGSGIAPHDLPHIFDRFYRAESSRERASGGSGLGLAIASAIVRAHGGDITVKSEEGVGTRFEIVLPHGKHPSARSQPQPIDRSP